MDLLPKEKWRPVFHQDKDRLIAAMDRELEKIPGVFWGFSQPISDNLEEAVSGVKGALAVKIYGDDLKTLEEKADEIASVMRPIQGVEDLGFFRVLGQPNLNFTVDRKQAARYGINVSDIQDAIQTAVGGNALTQVLIGEQRYDLVLRYLPEYRDTREAIEKIRLLSPTGERVSLAQLTQASETDGGSEIYREANSRYVAVKFSVRGRDLGSTVEEAMKKVNASVKLPVGYSIDWSGEYESAKRSERRLLIVLPITILVIYVILYTMFKSVKWALLILTNIAMAPSADCWRCGSPELISAFRPASVFSHCSASRCRSASSWWNTLINCALAAMTSRMQPWKGRSCDCGPLLMTMLVATLGLMPAAISRGIGSDSQRPFRHRDRGRPDCRPDYQYYLAADAVHLVRA